MGPDRSNGGESEYPALRRLRRGLLFALAVFFVGAALLGGFTPGGVDPLEGVVMAVVMGVVLLRHELTSHLTPFQEWGAYALVATASVGTVLVTGGDPSTELVLAWLLSLVAVVVYR